MRILLTAFEPYDEWSENSSWLALVELLKDHSAGGDLVTRRYPVDLAALQSRLGDDLDKGFDAILHLGQSPGATGIALESIALNVAGSTERAGTEMSPLVDGGPLAFQSGLPLGRWADMLRQHGIPACVSYHAGTYLCNALLYLTHHWCQLRGMHTPIGFVHLPLAAEQVARAGWTGRACLPVATLATSIRLLLTDLAHLSSESIGKRDLATDV